MKARAPRNRTLALSPAQAEEYARKLVQLKSPGTSQEIEGRVINQPLEEVLPFLPARFIDLLFIDPPYNLNKNFGTINFKKMGEAAYQGWLESWLVPLLPALKETASVYICGDWENSAVLYQVLKKYFIIRNRITWEREKGRGAKNNWKNCSEDIWFGTVSGTFTFNVEAVRLKRKVLAPYRGDKGLPKDWQAEEEGNYRVTYPSNLWTDITVPFWSMPENTDHPTQKPEKLLAKIILASSKPGDFVFDPFLGSGTTAVVAQKLGRHFAGVEIDPGYASLARYRLDLAAQETSPSIQGYSNGLFWERNSLTISKKQASVNKT